MGAYRKVPSFYGKGKPEIYYLAGLFALLGGLFFLAAMFAPKNSLSDWLGCLVFPILILLLIFAAIRVSQEGTSIQREMRSWFGTTDKAKTSIVDRKRVDNEVDDTARYYGYTGPDYSYYLTLKMVPSQLAIYPNETFVSVGVKEFQYQKYGRRTSVTIYYSREDPFVFLLEDEV